MASNAHMEHFVSMFPMTIGDLLTQPDRKANEDCGMSIYKSLAVADIPRNQTFLYLQAAKHGLHTTLRREGLRTT